MTMRKNITDIATDITDVTIMNGCSNIVTTVNISAKMHESTRRRLRS